MPTSDRTTSITLATKPFSRPQAATYVRGCATRGTQAGGAQSQADSRRRRGSQAASRSGTSAGPHAVHAGALAPKPIGGVLGGAITRSRPQRREVGQPTGRVMGGEAPRPTQRAGIAVKSSEARTVGECRSRTASSGRVECYARALRGAPAVQDTTGVQPVEMPVGRPARRKGSGGPAA